MSKLAIIAIVLLSMAHFSYSQEACPNDTRCSTCSGSKCTVCHPDYAPDSSGICKKVETAVDKCAIYASDGVCAYCDFTYNVSGGSKCVKIPVDGCDFANNTNECWVCSGGVVVKDGKCEDKDSSCLAENCKTCLKGGKDCFECNDGYANFNGGCVKFSHCVTAQTGNKDKCERCIEPAYNSNGDCKGKAGILGGVIIILFYLQMLN